MEDMTPFGLSVRFTAAERSRLFPMASFDRDSFEAEFDSLPQKNMAATGSLTTESSRKHTTQRLYDANRNGYDIFFKPHPADLSSADYTPGPPPGSGCYPDRCRSRYSSGRRQEG